MQKNKASVIIAARDEAPRIGAVLSVACSHPLVDEVIVVCDGSVDNTSEVARKFNAKVYDKEKPQGKTLAVKKGVSLAKNDVVILLDADLKKLTADNVTKLAEPVLNNKVDFTLSIRGNSSLIYRLFKMDFVSGERAIKKELLNDSKIWSKPKLGYGLEVLMNNSFLKNKKRFISVNLPNLYATPKSEKMSYWEGVWKDYAMVANIFRAFPFYAVGWQFVKMVYLNKKYKEQVWN